MSECNVTDLFDKSYNAFYIIFFFNFFTCVAPKQLLQLLRHFADLLLARRPRRARGDHPGHHRPGGATRGPQDEAAARGVQSDLLVGGRASCKCGENSHQSHMGLWVLGCHSWYNGASRLLFTILLRLHCSCQPPP